MNITKKGLNSAYMHIQLALHNWYAMDVTFTILAYTHGLYIWYVQLHIKDLTQYKA